MLSIGILMALATLGVYWYYLEARGLEYARTMAFTTIVFIQLAYSLSSRSWEHTTFRLGILSNKIMLLSIAIGLALQLTITYTSVLQTIFQTVPLANIDLAISISISAAFGFAIPELAKLLSCSKRKGQ